MASVQDEQSHSLSNVFGHLGSAAKRRHYDAPRKSRGSRLPAARAFYSFLVFVFWVFLLWLVGSFLVDAMQYASWGSVSFVSVESACRHYGVSMTSPMTSLTSLGVMFRNLEESRSRLSRKQTKYPRSSLRFNPGYAPTGAWTHPVLSRLLAAVWPYEFVHRERTYLAVGRLSGPLEVAGASQFGPCAGCVGGRDGSRPSRPPHGHAGCFGGGQSRRRGLPWAPAHPRRTARKSWPPNEAAIDVGGVVIKRNPFSRQLDRFCQILVWMPATPAYNAITIPQLRKPGCVAQFNNSPEPHARVLCHSRYCYWKTERHGNTRGQRGVQPLRQPRQTG